MIQLPGQDLYLTAIQAKTNNQNLIEMTFGQRVEYNQNSAESRGSL
jgi:hypothetical protein